MAKMKNKDVVFSDDKLVTAESVKLSWASVNEPDSEYDSYSVTMLLPVGEAWVDTYKQKVLDFENKNRVEQGQDPVEIPSNFLRKGEPRLSDDGDFWMITASGKTNTETYTTKNGKTVQPYEKNKPRVYDIQGVRSNTTNIWSGDVCKVAGSLGFWLASGTYGVKIYLKDVQQIEAGPGPTNSTPFGDESGADAMPF